MTQSRFSQAAQKAKPVRSKEKFSFFLDKFLPDTHHTGSNRLPPSAQPSPKLVSERETETAATQAFLPLPINLRIVKSTTRTTAAAKQKKKDREQ